MGICSLITRRLDVPGEPNAWIEVRPLSLKLQYALDLQAAADGRAAKAEDENVDADVVAMFAKLSRFLNAAIVAWSYPVPVETQYVEDMEYETMTWLAAEIGKGADVPLATTAPSNESLAESPETPLTDGQSVDIVTSSDVDQAS
jgi:hypothetical protein